MNDVTDITREEILARLRELASTLKAAGVTSPWGGSARRMGGAQRYPSPHDDSMASWSTINATSLPGTAFSPPSTRRKGDGFREGLNPSYGLYHLRFETMEHGGE
jgi:hypothetical protein